MATITKHENATNLVFHYFPILPLELRRTIWKHYLGEVTPQLYTFRVHFPRDPADHMYLQPPENFVSQPGKHPLQSLRDSSATRQTASATCVESRQVVLDLCPDTLTFGDYLLGFTGYHQYLLHPDVTNFLKCTLRFNSAQDIIIFQRFWDNQDQGREFVGSLPQDFLKLRHVGIAAGALSKRHYAWGVTPIPECSCETDKCQSSCKNLPLPRFLALFPSLRAFYIAGVPDGSKHIAGEQNRGFNNGCRNRKKVNCACPSDEPGHSWPVIRSPGTCGSFIIYDERSKCPFREFDLVKIIRKRSCPHFPYYYALQHLDIKFISPWDPGLNPPLHEFWIFNLQWMIQKV